MERAPSERSHETENTNHESGSEPKYEILSSPELRVKYLTLTDGIIKRMAEQHTDVAIFLDKSARPVAWMVNEMWDILAPRKAETGSPAKKPAIKFLNIDRETWGPHLGRSEDKNGLIDVGRIPQESIDNLKQVFAPVAGISKESDETLLTDKKVMVVDEVRSSGDTLHMAEGMLRRAFPDAARIDGEYWMLQPAVRDPRSGALISGEMPVWYNDRSNEGRLVANRDDVKSRMSNSSRQRAGGLWLSTRFRGGPDKSGLQLKLEVKMMARDLREHQLVYKPSSGWDEQTEDLDTRIERIDGISVDEYVKLLRESEGSNSDFYTIYKNYIKNRQKTAG